MKTKVFGVLGLILMLSGCATNGTKFFINNFEPESVSVQYKYYEKGQFSENSGFDYSPKSSVQVSKEILPKKILQKYPFYNSKSYFDSLAVKPKDAITYQCQIPSNSTLFIAPIYKYGQSIEYLILNEKDTIRFTPKLKSKLIEEKLAFYNNGLLGNPYFIVNIKLKEIKSFLNEK